MENKVKKLTSSHHIKLSDQFVGCFLGAACGDALGAGVEFRSAEEIAHRYPNGLKDFTGGSPFGFRPGDITDDTEQAILLAEALLEHEDGNYEEFWKVFGNKLVEWARTAKDIGGQTNAGIWAFKNGLTYDEAIEKGVMSRPSNGAVMRVYPVALRYYGDLEKIIKYTRMATAITHPHPEAIACALILNVGIHNLLNGNMFQIADYHGVYSYLGDEETKIFKSLVNIINSGAAPNQSYTLAREALQLSAYYEGSGLKTEEAIIASCSFGGDNDTHGAVTGAIVGAKYGADSLPRRWITNLFAASQIVELAEKLVLKALEPELETPEAIIEDDEDDDDDDIVIPEDDEDEDEDEDEDDD